MKMRIRLFCLFLLLIALSATSVIVWAQAAPSILSFTCDRTTITPGEAESGTAYTILSWQTSGLRSNDTLHLQVYVLGEWHDALSDNLPVNGTLRWAVPHSLDFSPPAFRLVVRDAALNSATTADLVIPYSTTIDPSNPPQVAFFVKPPANPGDPFRVSWQVWNRPARANLQFKQILNDRSRISIELPRDHQWIKSNGEGIVRPQLGSSVLQLSALLVNIDTGELYAESTLMVPVTVPMPTPVPPPKPGLPAPTAFPTMTIDPTRPEILSLSSNKYTLKRGETLTISWQTKKAAQVIVETYNIDYFPRYSAGKPDTRSENLPPNGSLNMTAPLGYQSGGWQIHVTARGSDPQKYTAKRIDVIFTDVPQPVMLNQKSFTVSADPVHPGDTVIVSWDTFITTRTSVNGVQTQQPLAGFDDKLWLEVTGVRSMDNAPGTPLNQHFSGLHKTGKLSIQIPEYDPFYNGVVFQLGLDVNGQSISYGNIFVKMAQP
jgi:hypothetical protein